VSTFYTKVRRACDAIPELRRYKRRILGCCRAPKDMKIQQRLKMLATQAPALAPVINDLLESE